MNTFQDGNNQILYNGDRVYSFEFDGTRVYGILYRNEEYLEVSEWYIEYDDGFEGAILEPKLVFKA